MQVLFFPLSVIALALMAAMLLIYLSSTWLLVPPDEPDEVHSQPPPIPIWHPGAGHNVPMASPPQQAEERPAGGIVIEK